MHLDASADHLHASADHLDANAAISKSRLKSKRRYHTITENFERLVHDEIRLVLHHRREIAINIRAVIDDRATVAFNER